MPADINWRLQTAKTKGIQAQGFNKVFEDLNVALVAGCTAQQESADAFIDQRYNGALTYFLLKELTTGNGLLENLSLAVEHVNSSIIATNQYTQNPQLIGNNKIMAKPFLAA